LLDEYFTFFRVIGRGENILVSASGNNAGQLSFSARAYFPFYLNLRKLILGEFR